MMRVCGKVWKTWKTQGRRAAGVRGITRIRSGVPGKWSEPDLEVEARRVERARIEWWWMRRVRDEVLAVTQRKQEPFSYGSLPGGDISLAP